MTIQHQPSVTKAFLWFPCVCKQHEQRLDWIATDKTPSSHLCVPLPHAPRLCRLLKPKRFQALLPLHGQCAHWNKLHVSQKNTYPHCAASASEIATSQTTIENTKAHKEDKIQPGGQPQLCPSLESPTSSPRWTSLWQPGSTDLYASLHPRSHTSMYLCIHASMHPARKRCRELRLADCLLRVFSLRFQVIQLVAQQFLTTDSRNVGNEMWQGSFVAGGTLVHRPVPDSIPEPAFAGSMLRLQFVVSVLGPQIRPESGFASLDLHSKAMRGGPSRPDSMFECQDSLSVIYLSSNVENNNQNF